MGWIIVAGVTTFLLAVGRVVNRREKRDPILVQYQTEQVRRLERRYRARMYHPSSMW